MAVGAARGQKVLLPGKIPYRAAIYPFPIAPRRLELVSVCITSISRHGHFPVTANPLDDPFYYLNNFMQVLDWLEQRFADVLSVDEQRFIHEFKRLPRESQALLVRMVMRKGVHFRASKLHLSLIHI